MHHLYLRAIKNRRTKAEKAMRQGLPTHLHFLSAAFIDPLNDSEQLLANRNQRIWPGWFSWSC